MEEKRTFNGKTWKQVEESLRRPFGKEDYHILRNSEGKPKTDANNKPIVFLPYNIVEKRLVESVGAGNFSVQPIALPDGVTPIVNLDDKIYIGRAVKLFVFDDEGKMKTETYGEAAVRYFEQKSDYNNLIENATQRATKRAMLHLCHISEEDGEGCEENCEISQKSATTKAKKEEVAKVSEQPLTGRYLIEILKPLALAKDCYRGEALCNGITYDIKLWADDANFIAKKYGRSVEAVVACFSKGKKFEVAAETDVYRSKQQLLIRDFVKQGGAKS